MLTKIFFACLFLGLFSASSPLSCRWLDHKFRQYSESSLGLIDMMANHHHTSEGAQGNPEVSIPHHLYNQASKASDENKLAFAVQVLSEVSALLEEDDSSSSWEESAVEAFLSVLNKQAEELQLCIGGNKRTNRRLHMYFKRLSQNVLVQMGHSAEAWELVRREIKTHLQLLSFLLTTN